MFYTTEEALNSAEYTLNNSLNYNLNQFSPQYMTNPAEMYQQQEMSRMYQASLQMQSAATQSSFMGYYMPYAEQALANQERQSIVSGLSFGVTSGALSAMGHPLLGMAAGMGASLISPEITRAMGLAEENPYIDVDTLTTSMMAESIHRTAWSTLGPSITGGFRGTSVTEAKRAAVYMMDQMRDMGLQGSELVNIMPALQQSGLLAGTEDFTDMINRATEIVDRISAFIKQTGATINEAIQYASMGAAFGGTVNQSLDMMGRFANVSEATATPISTLLQNAMQLGQPYAHGVGNLLGVFEGYGALTAMGGSVVDLYSPYGQEIQNIGGAAGAAMIVGGMGTEGLTRRRAAQMSLSEGAMDRYISTGRMPDPGWGGASANEQYEAIFRSDEYITENFENFARARRSYYDRTWDELGLTTDEARAGWLMQNRRMSGEEAIAYVSLDPNDPGYRLSAVVNTYNAGIQNQFNQVTASVMDELNQAGLIAQASGRPGLMASNLSLADLTAIGTGGNLSSDAITRFNLNLSSGFIDNETMDASLITRRTYTSEVGQRLLSTFLAMGYEGATFNNGRIGGIEGSIDTAKFMEEFNAQTADAGQFRALDVDPNIDVGRALEALSRNSALATALTTGVGRNVSDYVISSTLPTDVSWSDPDIQRYRINAGTIRSGIDAGQINNYTSLANTISGQLFSGRSYANTTSAQQEAIRKIMSLYFGDVGFEASSDPSEVIAQVNRVNTETLSLVGSADVQRFNQFFTTPEERARVRRGIETGDWGDDSVLQINYESYVAGTTGGRQTAEDMVYIADAAAIDIGLSYLSVSMGANASAFEQALIAGELTQAQSLARDAGITRTSTVGQIIFGAGSPEEMIEQAMAAATPNVTSEVGKAIEEEQRTMFENAEVTAELTGDIAKSNQDILNTLNSHTPILQSFERAINQLAGITGTGGQAVSSFFSLLSQFTSNGETPGKE